MKIIVIGGGASGLVAAIEAAKGGATVHILEKMNKPAKKILVTGNGKCNLTNEFQEEACYRGNHAKDVFPLIQKYGYEFTRNYFMKLGIHTSNNHGYIYPLSGQAETIARALISKAESLDIVISTDCLVERITKNNHGFQVTYVDRNTNDKKSMFCNKVILAAGGSAASKQGSDGSGFMLAERLGHSLVTPKPSLVALHSNLKYLKQLAGVRVKAQMKLMIDGKNATEEEGELQITSYGLSGVAIFQMSRYAVESLSLGRSVSVVVDLLPNCPANEWLKLLQQFISDCYYKSIGELLDGFMNWKLSNILLRELGIPSDMPCINITEKQMHKIVEGYKCWNVPIIGYNDFEQAQVTQGGVDLREVDMTTLESKLVSGLYFSGEILDVDGTCGGYNLQWAWTSGYVAGRESAGVTT